MNESPRVPPMPNEGPNVGRTPHNEDQQGNRPQSNDKGQPTINPNVVGPQQGGQQGGPQQGGHPSGPYGPYAGPYAAPAQKKPRRRRRVGMAVAASIVAAAVVGFGAGYFVQPTHVSVQFGAEQAQSGQGSQGQGSQGQSGRNGFGGQNGYGGTTILPGQSSPGQTGPQQGSGQGGQSTGTANGTKSASKAQAQGIVDITTVLKYEGAEAAGTGMILTSNGEILTNNHVVEGSTSIKAKVASTGKTYKARVVGTDKKDDVAVLKLTNASGLTPVQTESDPVSRGAKIVGIGNAGGTGSLTAAPGKVTALNQQITTMAEGSADSETLGGLIETSANVQAGDSGGPLEESDGDVVGMDTAASTNSSTGNSSSGYAIPISTALKIADTIESGHETNTVSIGYPAFLGIELGTATSQSNGQMNGESNGQQSNGQSNGQATRQDGAIVAGVIQGTPAASAGLQAGDVITKVDNHSIGSGKKLSSTLDGYNPGQSIKIQWTDVAGATHQAAVKLVDGPVE